MFRFLLLALFLPSSAQAEALTAPDFNNWYQIEVIVFKQRNAPDDDESWPPFTARYPVGMTAVSPQDDDQISPYNPDQAALLRDIQSQFTDREKEPGEMTADFLFGNKGKDRYNREVVETVTGPFTDGSTAGTDPAETIRTIEEEKPLPYTDLDEWFRFDLPQAFRALPEATHTLKPILGSLKRSSRYQVLFHQAWLQPLDRTPVPILIQAGEKHGDLWEIDGTMSFSRSRYLHVRTSLWYTVFDSTTLQEPWTGVPDPALANRYPGLLQADRNDRYTRARQLPLRHSRRMRSSVVHYIDHPYFGLLVRIDGFTWSVDSSPE